MRHGQKHGQKLERVHVYAGLWIMATSVALIFRFTFFSGTSSDARFPMTATYMLGTGIPLMVANAVEQRRLALAAGLRGRGTFGVLRGWVKTAGIELLLDDGEEMSGDLRKAIAEFSRFRRLLPFALTVYLVVVPVLLF